ncbi:hypothetical protein B566_EDAN010465, partial [Ephemera danica]
MYCSNKCLKMPRWKRPRSKKQRYQKMRKQKKAKIDRSTEEDSYENSVCDTLPVCPTEDAVIASPQRVCRPTISPTLEVGSPPAEPAVLNRLGTKITYARRKITVNPVEIKTEEFSGPEFMFVDIKNYEELNDAAKCIETESNDAESTKKETLPRQAFFNTNPSMDFEYSIFKDEIEIEEFTFPPLETEYVEGHIAPALPNITQSKSTDVLYELGPLCN